MNAVWGIKKRVGRYIICVVKYVYWTLQYWLKGKKRVMQFAVPMVWREQTNHNMDCYFCSTPPMIGMTLKIKLFLPKYSFSYLPSSYWSRLTHTEPPIVVPINDSRSSTENKAGPSQEANNLPNVESSSSKVPHFIAQELNDLVRLGD